MIATANIAHAGVYAPRVAADGSRVLVPHVAEDGARGEGSATLFVADRTGAIVQRIRQPAAFAW